MKCVKYLSGEVRRITDTHANELVSLGVGKYCPKSEWKALRVSPVVAQVVHTEEQAREIQRKADKKKGQQSKRNYRKS